MTEDYNDRQKEFQELEQKIQEAKQKNQNYDDYVLREIELLNETLEEFLQQVPDTLDPFDIGNVKVEQYGKMANLAKSINHPSEKIYLDKIKEIKCELFGKDNYEMFFGQDSK